MAEILFISKPVEPPWNDSSKNLVRDVAGAMARHTPVVMGRKGAGPGVAGVAADAVYTAASGGFAPALVDNVRVLGRLVAGRGVDVWHFFFAPNPKSSRAGTLASRLRRTPTVHTVCSAPAEHVDVQSVLFADRTVVLSRHTEARFAAAGVDPARLVRIPPAAPELTPLSADDKHRARVALGLPADVPIVVYPGDLEFGRGAFHVAEAFAELRSDAQLVVACRLKTERARAAEAELRARVDALGIGPRTHWLGETPRILDLLGAADVVALPSETLYAKMDYPLVLLEAMGLGVPVVVARDTPAEELAEGGGVAAVPARPEDVGAALASLLDDDAARSAEGAAARRNVLRHHARGPMAAAYEALYDELL